MSELCDKVSRELERYEHPLFAFAARPAPAGVEVEIRFKPPARTCTLIFSRCSRARSNTRSFPGPFSASSTTACTTTLSKCSYATRSKRIRERQSHASAADAFGSVNWPAAFAADGPITFAEFMRAVPVPSRSLGYYSKVTRCALPTFYTSVDVHPIFARLLARQVAEMWELLGRPEEFPVVEGGGRNRPFRRDSFWSLRARVAGILSLRALCRGGDIGGAACGAFRPLHPRTARRDLFPADELPEEIPCGCILSNELFDAMPVHRVVCERGELREVYVAADGDALREESGPLSTPEIAAFFREQGVTLREGQQAEATLDACQWIQDAGRADGPRICT